MSDEQRDSPAHAVTEASEPVDVASASSPWEDAEGSRA